MDKSEHTPTLAAQLEAVLFYRGEPTQIKELAKLLEVSREEILEALDRLEETLADRGIRLLRLEQRVELRTAPAVSQLIERIRREELRKDLGRAGAETLSLILYRSPISRAEIDYLRGVNSTFMLRNLMVRGLIERTPHPSDSRRYQYQPTTDLLAHLGITAINQLPEYHEIQRELENFIEGKHTRDEDAAA